jgi:UPF0755 protein
MPWIRRAIIAAIVLLLSFAALVLYVQFQGSRAIPLTKPQFFQIKSGEHWRQVTDELQAAGVIRSAWFFRLAAKIWGQQPILAASYEFKPGMTMSDIYDAITKGLALSNDNEVTLVEGWTMRQMGDELQKQGVLDSSDDFVIAASQNIQRLAVEYPFIKDIPKAGTLEGYLFPDTYRFYPESKSDAVIKRLLDNFHQHISADDLKKIAASGRTLHEVVILASIVEREVRHPEDMKTVAGIFMNRLEAGIALQADSTVNYITNSGRDRSTNEDITIDSPYNTYKYRGLPPGPISNPGDAALQAAINPADTNYLYFLTDDQGQVHYATTLDGHQQNRAKYLK